MSIQTLTRRSVVRGSLLGAVAAVVGFALARSSPAARAKTPTTAANAYGGTAATAGGSGSGSGGASANVLVPLDQVPTGGGVVVESAKVVVTRDQQGDVHAFSAVCTHQGCLVSGVADSRINCPCHGSAFDATTGVVVAGPATQPLASVAVTVQGGSVVTS